MAILNIFLNQNFEFLQHAFSCEVQPRKNLKKSRRKMFVQLVAKTDAKNIDVVQRFQSNTLMDTNDVN